jgi:hypothetical protein
MFSKLYYKVFSRRKKQFRWIIHFQWIMKPFIPPISKTMSSPYCLTLPCIYHEPTNTYSFSCVVEKSLEDKVSWFALPELAEWRLTPTHPKDQLALCIWMLAIFMNMTSDGFKVNQIMANIICETFYFGSCGWPTNWCDGHAFLCRVLIIVVCVALKSVDPMPRHDLCWRICNFPSLSDLIWPLRRY